MGVIHLGPLSALPGTCIVLRALAMLYDPGGTCTVLAYRPAHFCLRPKLEYRLPLVVLTRLNRFTLSHYGSRTPLSTLHAGLTASHARLSTGCLLGFAGSGLSPDYTIHAELAHNFRTLTRVPSPHSHGQRTAVGPSWTHQSTGFRVWKIHAFSYEQNKRRALLFHGEYNRARLLSDG